MDHIRAFCAEIGPRGPTTEGESRAAAYAAAKLGEAGARDVSVETFLSVPSLWWALEITLGLVLLATPVYHFGNAPSAVWPVVLCALAIYLIAAELSFWRLSLSNILPKRVSQNVYAKVPPKGPSRNKLVVIGHLDTNRTPILFHSIIVDFLPVILAVVVGCIVLEAILFAAGPLAISPRLILIIALVLDIPVILLLLAILHGDFVSPFTEGANDNASGAAIAISLAELFAREPLDQTEFWALCTGCEEATLNGIKAFLDKHGDELRDAWFVDLECVGIGDLKYITCEGMLKKYYCNPGLVRAAAEAAEAIGDDKIIGFPLQAGYTETTIMLKRGFRGITIVATPEDSDKVPHWHQASDRISNIEPQTIDKALQYVTAIARELDAS
jgi:hypothetical protein